MFLLLPTIEAKLIAFQPPKSRELAIGFALAKGLAIV